MLFRDKKGASNVLPREFYIFAIILIEIIFTFLYLGYGNTVAKFNNEVYNSGLNNMDYQNSMLNDESNSLLTYIITGITNAPAFLNICFVLFQAILVTMIIILLLHG